MSRGHDDDYHRGQRADYAGESAARGPRGTDAYNRHAHSGRDGPTPPALSSSYAAEYSRAEREADRPADRHRHRGREEGSAREERSSRYRYDGSTGDYDAEQRGYAADRYSASRDRPQSESSRARGPAPPPQPFREADSRGQPSPRAPPPAPSQPCPPTAPRLAIADDLPIEQMSLIDLFAFYVAKSGPSFEEEVSAREAENPAFRFLRRSSATSPAAAASSSPPSAAGQRDPAELYYRWRLYSLMQGDSMTAWRTDPFRMEYGIGAYVWVPPAAPVLGPDLLLGAYASTPASGAPPSARGLSRLMTGAGQAFGTLSAEQQSEWEQLLNLQPMLEALVAEHQGDGYASLERVLAAAGTKVLAADFIASRMAFAIEHAQPGGAAPHVMSLLLDAMVRVAYQSAGAVRQHGLSGDVSPRTAGLHAMTMLFYLFLTHDILQNCRAAPLRTDDDVRAAEKEQLEATQSSASSFVDVTGPGGSGASKAVRNADAAAATAALLLRGEGMPSHTVAPSSASSSTHKSPAAANSTRDSARPRRAPPLTYAARGIVRAIEHVLPTALEAAALTAVAVVARGASLVSGETAAAEKHFSDADARASRDAAPGQELTASLDTTSATPHALLDGTVESPANEATQWSGNDTAAAPLADSPSALGVIDASDPRCSILEEPSSTKAVTLTLRRSRPPRGTENASESAAVSEIGRLLLAWTALFVRLWSGKESGTAADELTVLRGRPMTLLLEKYAFLQGTA